MKKKIAERKLKDPGGREIERLWGDLPVVDADADLILTIRQSDVSEAKAKDPSGCVFARACKRVFDSNKVLIFRSIAYVEMPDKNGKRCVKRFTVSSEMRDLITNFDQGNSAIKEAGFVLKKPTGVRTLRAKRKKDRRHEKKRQLRGYIRPKGRQGQGRYADEPLVIDTVRNGSGCVSFMQKKD